MRGMMIAPGEHALASVHSAGITGPSRGPTAQQGRGACSGPHSY